eukprot:TRINITY_DN30296_c0_g1_i1.p1 TRINITY_DN30296_c0_g1~~TRINITY_DN30296_c0_g1_i1.p1  ORF type:complete len:1254 (+),score=356.57 TRINITY_DN30296_c0_g1_i1:108-3869(+)
MSRGFAEGRPPIEPSHRSFWARATYSAADEVLRKGYTRPLLAEDIPPLEPRQEAQIACEQFEQEWQAELQNDSPSLLRTLRRCYETRFLESVSLEFLEVLLSFVGPLALKAVIGFTADKSRPVLEGVALVVLLFISSVVKGVSASWTLSITTSVGMDVHSSVVSQVYRKSLRLSPSTTYSRGAVVNIQSNDCLRVANIVSALNVLWTAPLTIIVAVILLVQSVGTAAFAGFGFMLFLVPINGIAVAQMESIREEVIQLTDSRVTIMTELLGGARIVKFTTLEEHFKSRILNVRRRELDLLAAQSYWHAFTSFLVFATPTLTSVFTFVTYAALGNTLDAKAIFTALSLFNLLRVPLSFLPVVIFSMVESSVALDRVQAFLTAPEINPNAVEQVGPRAPITISSGVFGWDSKAAPTLGSREPINLTIPPGCLCMIVGKVGSGKSSVLSALLGMIEKRQGRVLVPSGTVAYCPQQPWLANDTVRGNILFGNSYSPSAYDDAIRVCSLKSDLTLLPNGDLTEIGERGVTMSGGQRQRISLARAVYSNVATVLLDDVLSAVDPHVAQSIFDQCIVGALNQKTRVMVTNAVQFLPKADLVVVLDDSGNVSFQGSYPSLVQSGVQVEQLAPVDEAAAQTETVPGAAAFRADDKDPFQTTGVGQLHQEEERAVGAVSGEVIHQYMTACGETLLYFGVFVILAEVAQATSDIWLAMWSDKRLSPSPGANFYLTVYVVLGMVVALLSFLRGISAVEAAIRASRRLHAEMLSSVLRAPASFFDVTPLGRILARFSKDLDSLDTSLADGLNSFFTVVSMTIGTLLVVLVALPPFAVALVPLGIFYAKIMNYYRSTSRELARISATASSPIYAFFAETLSGTASVRAYHRVVHFQDQNDHLVDRYHRVYWFSLTIGRWLNVRLEFIGAVIVLVAGLLVAFYRDSMDPGQVGLVLTYGLQMVAALEMIVTGVSSMETQLNAVERVLHYARSIPQEAPAVIENARPSFDWLEHRSDIVVRNLSVRYRPDLPNVLHAINVVIPSRAKCGVVGRTGSGKSSFFLTLLRMMEASSGTIEMGGMGIQDIGLRDLRARIAIVPQEPTLFSGTLRSNLDPYGEYSDRDILESLEKAHCREVAERDAAKLDAVVLENGENFSVGERQLLCLARALLRRSRVLLMDEVTASVDIGTDRLIQETVTREFDDCTVLTIAHRLDTVINGTHILVLDQGRVAEFGSPRDLLLDPRGTFNSMVASAGPAMAERLRQSVGLQ